MKDWILKIKGEYYLYDGNSVNGNYIWVTKISNNPIEPQTKFDKSEIDVIYKKQIKKTT